MKKNRDMRKNRKDRKMVFSSYHGDFKISKVDLQMNTDNVGVSLHGGATPDNLKH